MSTLTTKTRADEIKGKPSLSMVNTSPPVRNESGEIKCYNCNKFGRIAVTATIIINGVAVDRI